MAKIIIVDIPIHGRTYEFFSIYRYWFVVGYSAKIYSQICVHKWNKSIYAIISFVLILLVFASFIELATGGNHKNNLVYSLIAISIILSWLGIRGIAGISWILVLASAVYIVIANNLALGFNGFIYISLGFLGLLMHSGLNPGMLFKNIKEEYSSTAIHAKNVVKSEIEKTGEMTSKAI